MKKLLIMGLFLGSFTAVLNGGNGGFEIEEPEFLRFIGLANDPNEIIAFKRNFNDRVHNPNATYNNATLLYHVIDALENPKQVMQFLIEQGADVNYARKDTGVTPLMRAAELGKLDAVELLLKKNAKTSLKSQSDRTALEYATRARSNWERRNDETKVAALDKIIELLGGKSSKTDIEQKTAASAPKPQISVTSIKTAISTIPEAPAWTDKDYQNLTNAINKKLAEVHQTGSIAIPAAKPSAPLTALEVRSAANSIPNAPALTAENIRAITTAMNEIIEKEAKTTQEQESKASSAVGQSPVAALNEIKAILIRNAKRPSFDQWYASFDAQFGGKGEEDYTKLGTQADIIRRMGPNERTFIEALFELYAKASPQDRTALINGLMNIAQADRLRNMGKDINDFIMALSKDYDKNKTLPVDAVMSLAIPIFNNEKIGAVKLQTLKNNAMSLAPNSVAALVKIQEAKKS